MYLARMRLAGLRPLRHRQYALFWASGAASDIGTWVQLAAIGSLVAASSGSTRSTALVAAATFAPQGLCSPLGGVLADRYDRRRIFLGTLGIQTVVTAMIAVAIASGVRSASALSLMVLVQASAGSLGGPAMQAILPDLVPHSELTAAVSLGLTGWNAGRVVGPLLAALLVPLGTHWAIGANGISFAILWCAIARLRRSFPPAVRDHESVRAELADGIVTLMRTRGCITALLSVIAMHLTLIPFMGMVPATARALLSANGETPDESAISSTASWLMSAQGIGAIIGSVLVVSLLHHMTRAHLLTIVLTSAAALLIAHAVAPTVALSIAAIAPLGASIAIAQSTFGGVVQRDAPTEHRGRVLSWYAGCMGLSYATGLWWVGSLADRIGIETAFVVAALVAMALLIVATRISDTWGPAINDVQAPESAPVLVGASSSTQS
jgi:MFS family permease